MERKRTSFKLTKETHNIMHEIVSQKGKVFIDILDTFQNHCMQEPLIQDIQKVTAQQPTITKAVVISKDFDYFLDKLAKSYGVTKSDVLNTVVHLCYPAYKKQTELLNKEIVIYVKILTGLLIKIKELPDSYSAVNNLKRTIKSLNLIKESNHERN